MNDQYQDWLLEDFITELAEIGNQMCETLEGYDEDDVIKAYLDTRMDLIAPIFIKPDKSHSKPIRDRWDDLIGKLQEEKLVGPFIEEGEEYLVEVDNG